MYRKWTKEEDFYLKNMVTCLKAKEAAEALGRGKSAVSHRSIKLGLKWCYNWDEKDDYSFKCNYERIGCKATAALLNKSPQAIAQRAFNLGLKAPIFRKSNINKIKTTN